MRFHGAILAIGLAAAAAHAAPLELIEYKSGKILTVEGAARVGDSIHVRVATPADQFMLISIPMDRIVPEYVFYVWERGIAEGDSADRLALADWARRNGLFRHALQLYETIAQSDPETKQRLPELAQTLHEEEATWLFDRASALFKSDEVRDARIVALKVLDGFKDSKEYGRTQELLKMIGERDQFLAEAKRRREEERRVRRQRTEVKTQAARIAQADAYAASAHLRYTTEARWRLRWAGQLYEGAVARLKDLRPFVEDENLRKEIDSHVAGAAERTRSAYLRLADLRYLGGDYGGALDAAHKILDLDPDNAAAAKLRDRILDGPPLRREIRYEGMGYVLYRGSLLARRYPVGLRFGCHFH